MDKKYKIIYQKLERLEGTQTPPPSKQHKSFRPWVVNQTNITFSPEELNLLNKGLKYNLSYKRKNCIKNIAIEAETAITKLQVAEQDYIR